jgi:cation transport ATPase
MSAALALGETLAGSVVAVMYAGGNVLEDFAVARAERDLRSLVDRAPGIAHRRAASAVEDVPIEQVAIGAIFSSGPARSSPSTGSSPAQVP